MPKRSLKNKTIEVILLESDKHLGEKFEVVRVAPIFARNVLFPQSKAVPATAEYKHNFEKKMEAAANDRVKKAAGLEDLFTKIQQAGGLTIERKVNEANTLYDKVDAGDISAAIKEAHKLDVDSHLFKMKTKISTPGETVVPFLYKEMKKMVTVNVVAAKEEKKEETKEA